MEERWCSRIGNQDESNIRRMTERKIAEWLDQQERDDVDSVDGVLDRAWSRTAGAS